MQGLFVILNYISVLIVAGCTAVIATHEPSRMQKLALMEDMFLLFCCIGFLFKVEGQTAGVILTGYKLLYATVTHCMFFMLLFILEYCRMPLPVPVKWFAHGVNFFFSAVVLTMDYHGLFYKSYWLLEEAGGVSLEKDYGIFHTLVVGVFAVYMIAALTIAVIFSVKNVRNRSRYVWLLIIAVSFPCLSYVIPKLTGMDNDLQPMAFALFAAMLLIMVYRNKLYDMNNIGSRFSVRSMKDGLIVFDRDNHYMGCNAIASGLFERLNEIKLDTDLVREVPELRDFLQGKSRELRSGDRIFDVSLIPIQDGPETGSVLCFEDVTMERNYADLLREQKEMLEARVELLDHISHTDELTGIGNRRSYEEMLEHLRNTEDVSKIAMVSIDLNGLKDINDNIGHRAGDEIIQGAARLLSVVFAEKSSCFRTGGDEFFIILEDSSELGARLRKLEVLCEAWRGGMAAELSLAVGSVRALDLPGKSVDELVVAADQEMYKNKQDYYLSTGRDRRKN